MPAPTLTRIPDLPPVYEPTPQSDALFNHGMDPFPQGRVLVVYAADWCPHCHRAMENNGYPTKTANGTPILWMNDSFAEVNNRLLDTPGISLDKAQNSLVVNGELVPGYPTVIEVVNGRATQVVMEPGTGQAWSPEAPGSLDKMGNLLAAQEKARAALQTPGGGTTVPQNTQPQPNAASRYF